MRNRLTASPESNLPTTASERSGRNPDDHNCNAMDRRVIERVERTIAGMIARHRTDSGAPILIALSGGADSVALTHALWRIRADRDSPRCTLAAAHLNHRLRGTESDRDERFVRELCRRMEIELIAERVATPIASSNLEERARDLRYEFLNRTADRVGASLIALAHHGDDQAETVILRLLRGSGAAGLAAMDEFGPGRIVRPMLALRREEILSYLDAIGAACVSDSTNQSPAILRNRVRHELLPMLERDYAPRLSRRLTGLAREMRMLDDYVAGEGRRELGRRMCEPGRIDLAGFGDLHPALAAAMMREWMRERRGNLRRVDRAEIDRIGRFCATGAPGSVMRLGGGIRLRCEYGSVVCEPAPTGRLPAFAIELALDGVTEAAAAGFAFFSRRLPTADPALDGAPAPRRARLLEALFDAGQIEAGLVVRGFRNGDRVRPLGMTGTRKVHDVFVDRKLVRERRATWPIIECQGEIIWIPGMVRSRVALVTGTTRKVLQLQAKPCASSSKASLLRN
jgi:tRNA(Ile)-lysidine synthase